MQKRITNKFLTCKRDKDDRRKRNIKTLGLKSFTDFFLFWKQNLEYLFVTVSV